MHDVRLGLDKTMENLESPAHAAAEMKHLGDDKAAQQLAASRKTVQAQSPLVEHAEPAHHVYGTPGVQHETDAADAADEWWDAHDDRLRYAIGAAGDLDVGSSQEIGHAREGEQDAEPQSGAAGMAEQRRTEDEAIFLASDEEAAVDFIKPEADDVAATMKYKLASVGTKFENLASKDVYDEVKRTKVPAGQGDIGGVWEVGKGYHTACARQPIFEPWGKSDTDRSEFDGTTPQLERPRAGHQRGFLNAKIQGENVYVSPPPALVKRNIVNGSVLCKLKRAPYGLHRNPKFWEHDKYAELEGKRAINPDGQRLKFVEPQALSNQQRKRMQRSYLFSAASKSG
ncbi:hypothetical protein AK812_SmicGene18335 [Symbiodinium microadriaticum]|uniref:Uncharacterized protein n=1 Tax=Symbiodinium microadriaticum TaxID=2951 RepID=A0A1Q9DVC8_SYMMI|nr:hypothetical protein AK812_SmicGene18335 [Symbiodinium microadriaticum]